MAAVFTHVASGALIGGFKVVIGTIAMDNSYPTNGEVVDLSDYFGTAVYWGLGFDSNGFILCHDRAAVATGCVEAFWADYDAVADGALVEVANTTNLAAITACPMIFIGN